MGKCTFDCTLMSQGCMQDCVTTNNSAKALLECSYNKCLNYWAYIWMIWLFVKI